MTDLPQATASEIYELARSASFYSNSITSITDSINISIQKVAMAFQVHRTSNHSLSDNSQFWGAMVDQSQSYSNLLGHNRQSENKSSRAC